jgi:hypothetical protein
MNSGVSKALRNLVFERDSYTCVICDNPANDAHHVLPRSHGGRNIPQNLVSLCRGCHRKLHHEENLLQQDIDDLELWIIAYVADYYAEENQFTLANYLQYLADTYEKQGDKLLPPK